MATIPLINAIVFGAYSQGKDLLMKLQSTPRPLNNLEIGLAGAYAGALSCFVACPVELIKTRLQIQYGAHDREAFRGPLDATIRIANRRGIKGLFRGMSATLYREIPGYGGQFFLYEWLKRLMTKTGESTSDLGPGPLILAGGSAGIFGWALSYPQDFIKSQIQAEPYQTKTPWRKHPFLLDGGFWDCFKYTVKTKGPKALWRGFGTCVARAFPANAAGFLAYEMALKFMRSLDTDIMAPA
jgi:solute carrier family 25 carnitine/acylcarnitine transporter 20/29